MTDFQKAYDKIIRGHEGGYVNHPDDKGKETYKGIARASNPNWPGWFIIDDLKTKADFPAILERAPHLQDFVFHLYKQKYWDPLAGDSIGSQDVAVELFDISVNMGAKTAGEFLQTSINLLNKNKKLYDDITVDGIVGIKTFTTLNKFCSPESIIKVLNGLQFERYKEICQRDPSQEIFFHGWLTRV